MILRNEIVRISPVLELSKDIQEKTFLFHSAYKNKEGKIRIHLIPCPKVGILDFYYIHVDKVEEVEAVLIPTGEFVD
jgi:hypothetical protein